MMAAMTTPDLQVRRATIEDLPKLMALWEAEGLPSESLSKRFKEFQVVETNGGDLRGTLGLQIVGMEGCLHSEAFALPEEADPMRDHLLQRMQIIMKNHGLFRVWTQLATPFYHANGFLDVGDELRSKLPEAFAGDDRPWLCLKLKDEPVAAALSLDQEFELFKTAEKEQREKMYRQAKTLRTVAAVIIVGVILLILGSVAFYFFRVRMRNQRNTSPSGIIPARAQMAGCLPSIICLVRTGWT